MLSLLRVFTSRLGGFFGRRKADLEFDEEMRIHLHLLTEQGIRRGMSREEARAAARRQFGNIPLLQQSRREMRSIVSIDNLVPVVDIRRCHLSCLGNRRQHRHLHHCEESTVR
jgi:macrolide transport system ATP-binding/permease protein